MEEEQFELLETINGKWVKVGGCVATEQKTVIRVKFVEMTWILNILPE